MGEIYSWEKHLLRVLDHPSPELERSGWGGRMTGFNSPSHSATVLPFVREPTDAATKTAPPASTDTSRTLVLTAADYAAHNDWKM